MTSNEVRAREAAVLLQTGNVGTHTRGDGGPLPTLRNPVKATHLNAYETIYR